MPASVVLLSPRDPRRPPPLACVARSSEVRCVCGAYAVCVRCVCGACRYVIEVVVLRLRWNVRRRFNEFHALHQRLVSLYPNLVTSVYFPEKTIFQMSQRVIEERRVALQRYLLDLASISVPASCGLIRIRELDEFLEVRPRHASRCHARLAVPRTPRGATHASRCHVRLALPRTHASSSKGHASWSRHQCAAPPTKPSPPLPADTLACACACACEGGPMCCRARSLRAPVCT